MQITTLDKFPLKWRWTEPQYCILSNEELSLIEPLSEESAKEVWEKSLSFISRDSDFSPNRELFKEICEIECNDENDIEIWLKQRIQAEKVIVSWQPDTAVIVSSKLFIEHWEDFCYPSSDDVSIWPFDEKWVVHYWHEEMFCYGKSTRV